MPPVPPPDRRSIRTRLLRALLVWALLWSTALAFAVWLAVREEVNELLDDGLKTTAEEVIGPLLRTPAPPLDNGPAAPALASAAPGEPPRFAWQQVEYIDGARLLRHSAGAPLQPLRATPTAGYADVGGWRVYGLALGADAQMLYVAQSRVERAEALDEVALAVLMAGVPMGLLGLLWLGARVRQELAPLTELSQRLARHDPLHPGAGLGDAAHEELQPVHQAIDALAARLTRRIAQERAFTAHAAHALRTPLAGIDAQLTVALREAPADLQPRLQRVRTAAARLQRVVVGLLALFRSGVEVQRVPHELAALAARLPTEGLQVQALGSEALAADADLLTAALLNLLDNAQRHGARTVTLSSPAPQVLRVHDDGSGLPAARRADLQRALDAEDYAGRTGLGLMLADLVARAHGGRLKLPAVETGFAADLGLGPPAA
ncbi:MAG: two-component sensor histidine kinase [Leptothrix sp. (in: Bacteria)]|nr:two-component sensor histidine kinase [Leptothrix sp. (in: b-proteobacteria)]